MIKITLTKDENFLKVAETLTRMGVANKSEKKLYQSCHILKKQGEYYITHFKEMMKLDGKQVNISNEDDLRTLMIARTIASWNLIELVQDDKSIEYEINFRILKHAEKHEWSLIPKYRIGNV